MTITTRTLPIMTSAQQWKKSVFILFDDGDIIDSIDLRNLENHHECTQDAPEHSTAQGGRFQSDVIADIVGIGLNRINNTLSFEITHNADDILSADALQTTFEWYISWNTKTNQPTVHYSDEDTQSQSLATLSWCAMRDLIIANRFMLHVLDHRDKVVPLWHDNKHK